ncbi:MAG: MFS transporter [Deltaproteobacteria bacterium]|nr:MFS transporter [Deltaproteobacteria bacterium]
MIGLASLCKLILNTARRFVYPFAPSLSKGMGVPLTAITSLIAVNQATSIFGILFGPVADHFGYKWMMLAGLGMLVFGMGAAGLFPYYHVILATLFLAGLGKSVFDLALQAQVGVTVPFRERAMVVGLMELSWAGSTLVGIPAIGLAINGWGWRSAFLIMGGMGLLAAVTFYYFVLRNIESHAPAPRMIGMRELGNSIGNNRAVKGMLVFCFLFA